MFDYSALNVGAASRQTFHLVIVFENTLIWEYISSSMGIRMKTTIEIADSLLEKAKKLAVRERTTVRALVESGLRQVIAQKTTRGEVFRLRDATFKGKGLAVDVSGASWAQIRELAYEGRGG